MKKYLLSLLCMSAFLNANYDCYSCNRLEVGPHFSYGNLEFKNAPSRAGFVAGASAWFMHYRQSGLYTDVYFRGSWAGDLDDCQGNESKLGDYLAEARTGYLHNFCDESFIVFFAGLGYNRLRIRQDNINQAQQQFHYNKVYIPIGIYSLWQINDCFSLAARVKVKPDVHPILSFTSANNECSNESDIFFKLDYRYGIDVQIPFTYYFSCDCISGLVSLIPYLDWNIYGKTLLTNDVCSLRRILTGAQLVIGIEY